MNAPRHGISHEQRDAKLKNIFQKLTNRWEARRNSIMVKKTFRHLTGPSHFQLDHNEIALILVGRNVSHFLEHNIEYHRELGVTKVVYIDNGSDDESLHIAQSFPDTITAKTSADFSKYQNQIRFFANTLYTKGGWHLAIDPDELIDFADRKGKSLQHVVEYMEGRGHTGLVAQMLEMVSSENIRDTQKTDFRSECKYFTRYDLRNISEEPYHKGKKNWQSRLKENTVTNPDINVLHGGLRRTVFGEDCCLTKHALFKPGPGVSPMSHPHVTTGLRCTDFTAVLKHYKFAGNMISREQRLLQEGRISHGETALRMSKLESDPETNLGSVAQFSCPTPEKLIEQGFLKMSPDAADFFGVPLPLSVTLNPSPPHSDTHTRSPARPSSPA